MMSQQTWPDSWPQIQSCVRSPPTHTAGCPVDNVRNETIGYNLQQETYKQPSQLYKLYQLIIFNLILGSLLFANLAHADVHHGEFADLKARADLAR